jgi:Flp pilus assembly protein TadG
MRTVPRRERTTPGARRGAAAAELAVLLPFLVLMLALAVDFCRVYHHAQVVQASAQSGALYASETAKRDPNTTTDDTDAAVQAAVAQGTTLNPPLAAGNVNVTIQGGVASVTVTYQLATCTSVPGMPGMLTVTRTVTMPIAPQPGQ